MKLPLKHSHVVTVTLHPAATFSRRHCVTLLSLLLHFSRRHCHTPAALSPLRCIVLPSYGTLPLLHSHSAFFRCYVLTSVFRLHCYDFRRQTEAPTESTMLLSHTTSSADTLSRSASTFSRSYCYAMHAVKALHFYVSMPALIRRLVLPSIVLRFHCYDHCLQS